MIMMRGQLAHVLTNKVDCIQIIVNRISLLVLLLNLNESAGCFLACIYLTLDLIVHALYLIIGTDIKLTAHIYDDKLRLLYIILSQLVKQQKMSFTFVNRHRTRNCNSVCLRLSFVCLVFYGEGTVPFLSCSFIIALTNVKLGKWEASPCG